MKGSGDTEPLRIEFDPASFRILPAGAERLERGRDGDLPLRWLDVTRGEKTLSVAVGPVDYGGPDEELWEFEVSIG